MNKYFIELKKGAEKRLQPNQFCASRKIRWKRLRYPIPRPSAVVNVATDWFTGAGLKCPSKCTIGL